MSLYFNKTLENGLKIVVWTLTETLEDLKNAVELTEEETEAFDKISVPEKKREFLAGKYVLKQACEILGIACTGIEKDEHGKPFLSGREYEISLTHTVDYIGTVFHKGSPVGVDLEKPRNQIFRVLPRLYSESELSDVGQDLKKATIYWSAKEALYKLYGKRSVDFKENLFLEEAGGELRGTIIINGETTRHQFFITEVGEYYLVVAY